MYNLVTPNQNCIGVSSQCNQARNKRYPDWKGRSKTALFANAMILYVENPKESPPHPPTQNLLELIKFSKDVEYISNI